MNFGLDLSDRFYNKKVQSISIFLKRRSQSESTKSSAAEEWYVDCGIEQNSSKSYTYIKNNNA